MVGRQLGLLQTESHSNDDSALIMTSQTLWRHNEMILRLWENPGR